MVLSKAAQTLSSIVSSCPVRYQLPGEGLLSLSSPAVLPMITIAASASRAASLTSSSSGTISSWNQGSVAQPRPGSKG